MSARKNPSPPLPPLPTSLNLKNLSEGSHSQRAAPPVAVSASGHTTASGDTYGGAVQGEHEPDAGALVVDPRRQPELMGHAKNIASPARLEDESAEQHERFLSWLLPGDGKRRSFSAVGREYGLSTSTVAEAAARYSWRDRAIAYDRRAVAASAERAGQLAAEAGTNALALCVALKDQVAGIVAQLDDEPDAAIVLNGALDASKVLERLVKTERLILGLSTQNQSVIIDDKRDAKADYSLLSDSEMHLGLAGDAVDALARGTRREELDRRERQALDHIVKLLKWCPMNPTLEQWRERDVRMALVEAELAAQETVR